MSDATNVIFLDLYTATTSISLHFYLIQYNILNKIS